jgi:hypothetical protein
VVRDALIRNLPFFLFRRFCRYEHLNICRYIKNHFLVFLLSSLVGSFSHLFLDSFTNFEGYFFQEFGFLKRAIVVRPYGHAIKIGIWEVCSVIGGLAVVKEIFNLPKHESKGQPLSYSYWPTVIIVTIVFVWRNSRTGVYATDFFYWGLLAVSGAGLGIVVASALFRKEGLKKTKT